MGDRTAAWGQVRVANELKRRGLSVSAAGVRCVWRRHELETMEKRLKALEAKSAQEGLVLSEAQLAALEEAKGDKEAHGELRTQATAARRTPSMCGHSRAWGAFTSRPSSTPTPSWPSPNSYDRKTPLQTLADSIALAKEKIFLRSSSRRPRSKEDDHEWLRCAAVADATA
jgi:hypothetical protein